MEARGEPTAPLNGLEVAAGAGAAPGVGPGSGAGARRPSARDYFDDIKRRVMAQMGRGRGAAGGRRARPRKGAQKEYTEYLGLQPNVKFKCRKCSSMSFRSLAMLKEHQRGCRAPAGQAAPAAVGGADPGGEGGAAGPCRVTRKVYLCSACSTYYENWNLFLHMREIHSRHICLFCLGMFSKAEKLVSHLMSKHGVVDDLYGSKEEFLAANEGSLYLMCCYCDKLYTENDHFALHACSVPVPMLISRKLNADASVPVEKLAKTSTNGPRTDVLDKDTTAKPANDEDGKELVSSRDTSETRTATEGSVSLSSESMDISDIKVDSPECRAESDKVPTKQQVPGQAAKVSEITPDIKSGMSPTDKRETSVPMELDLSKNENNNITNEKQKDGGIKLKLSLNKAQSPVIINSTVQPDVGIVKPQTRPCRPPGGVPVLSSIPLNNIHSTIYDNKPEDLNTLNKVPKLTVRVPKGLLDKDSSSEYSSDSDISDKLTVDDLEPKKTPDRAVTPPPELAPAEPEPLIDPVGVEETSPLKETTSAASIEEQAPLTELTLDRPLDKYPLKELLKVFVAATMYSCVYCNHVRKIAVNCKQLSSHMLSTHRFSATVDSITAEELMPEKINQTVKSRMDEGDSIFVNLDTYDSVDPCRVLPYIRTYECFHCYFTTTVHKELYFHNRKVHQKTILVCGMCRSHYYSYSELLCHLCPGTYTPEYEMRFRCCMCDMDNMPSSFRLMVHMRKVHHACDVCTEDCHDQSRLSIHVAKHKLHHFCYRCGIAYRNKADITKHLFWKHGTESILCKRCVQKKWPHVYHFCVPPNMFVCDECNLNFTRPVCLKVHKRFHSGEFPHPCAEEGCGEKFVSKKLLTKHMLKHQEPKVEALVPKDDNKVLTSDIKEEHKPATPVEDNKDHKNESKEGAKPETGSLQSTKVKKKKNKDKDSFLMDVNLPALNLSESDSEESDSGTTSVKKEDLDMPKVEKMDLDKAESIEKPALCGETIATTEEEKPSEQQVLDIWDNFKQYQAKVEKVEKPKTPPLVPIRKHVCESDHDYCLIPNDFNGEGYDSPGKKKRSPRKRANKTSTGSSSSSSSSSSSGSGSSRGSSGSSSSSSGSSSSGSSSDSDSSESGKERKKKVLKKLMPKRRESHKSNNSAVDVIAMEELPVFIPEKREPLIGESDLETDESDTDEEFYDEHPQRLANKLYAEKRNQLMLLASVADNGTIKGDISRQPSPGRERSRKKKSKSKKRKKSKREGSHRMDPIKLNIPKDAGQADFEKDIKKAYIPNKITISLHSNKVQIPEMPKSASDYHHAYSADAKALDRDNKRASKRRRIPNRFYGYSSDEDAPASVFKPQQPPKLEWRKEDLPSPTASNKPVPTASHRATPPTVTHRIQSYNEPTIRMSTPVPDPVPPPNLMNTESTESSETDSSDEGTLKIFQPDLRSNPMHVPPAHVATLPPAQQNVYFPKPAGAREPLEGESVYCYCRCPYDEVSEMIACDADGCSIEWFHFECVGIMVPPKGKWYCPDCRARKGLY